MTSFYLTRWRIPADSWLGAILLTLSDQWMVYW